MTMERDQALKVLAQHYPEGIVVPVYQARLTGWQFVLIH